MSNEIMLALSNEVDSNRRYNSPPALTRAGQTDRRHEHDHALTIREYERQARERIAATAVETVGDIAWIQGRARVVSEAKFVIDRAQKETEILAQGNPIKQVKCAILDDELFSQIRTCANKSMPHVRNRLF